MTGDEWVWVPFEVDKKYDGYRIDRFLTQRLLGYSRSKIQTILEDARVLKGDRPAKANTKVHTGEKIHIAYLRRPEKPVDPSVVVPILFEDDDLLVVNKPANVLSHPTDKILHNTVLSILRTARSDLPKLHLLHRLDRETSGVIALAKNPKVAKAWSRQMEGRHIQKEYLAVVRGKVTPAEGVIDLPIGPEGGKIRVRQWVNVSGAVSAITKYRTESSVGPGPKLKRSAPLDLAPISILRVFPQTGRLHQIRVHFAALGHPLLGDPLYTGRGEIYKKLTEGTCTDADRASLGFPRVALHATALTFIHPTTKKELRVEAPVPPDMTSYAECSPALA